MRALFALLLFGLNASAAPVKLALNWKAEPQFGGFYEADLKGYFKKAGFEVAIQEGGSGTPTVQMLAAGQVDWAIVSAEEILIANDRNPKNPLVAVFATFQTAPVILMCHPEREFKTIADIFKNDGVLAWQSGLTYAQFLKRKYPEAKVKTVPYLGGVANFLADKKFCQQGFISSEPFLAEAAGIHPGIFLVSDEGFNPYLTVLAVKKSYLEKNPEIAKRFVGAVREGWASYLADGKATNQELGRKNKAMKPATVAQSAEAQKRLILPADTSADNLGKMTETRWKTLIDQLKELKLIEKAPLPAEVFKNI